MISEHRRCGIIPGLKRTNMPPHEELGFIGPPGYKDADADHRPPMALPAGLRAGWHNRILASHIVAGVVSLRYSVLNGRRDCCHHF